jgi:dipeptidase E
MRFLLTSAGIKNTSIHDALVDLLGKPIAESNALCIPTAVYAMPGGAGMAWRLINGRATTLPSLREAVYVGVSAGSMVIAPNVGDPPLAPAVKGRRLRTGVDASSASVRAWRVRPRRHFPQRRT